MIDFSKPLFLSIPGTHRIRFTPHGIEQLRARFAAAGVDIRTVRTRQTAIAAIEASSHVTLEQLALAADEDPGVCSILERIMPGFEEHG